MYTSPALQEITAFLENKDDDIALRRLLDAALDSNDPSIIYGAIALSKKIKTYKTTDPANGGEVLREGAAPLMQKISERVENYTLKKEDLLRATDIKKTYNKSRFSLSPVSLKLQTGEVLGIVGENGNGKTTLLRMLGGQLALDSGTIQYTLLKQPDHYSIKQHVAFIPQRIPRWYGGLQDNLHFSAAIAGIHGKENEMMVDFMLERLGLSEYAHLTWDRISSGYRTRFEIARILLQKPGLLILDEPLANLDIKAQQTILTDLINMARSQYHSMGIILSSQQLHEVEKVADEVMFIKDGKCKYNELATQGKSQHFIIEIETHTNRELMQQALPAEIQVQYNGGFYTLSSSTLSPDEMLNSLLKAKVQLTYFRDITNSTKRFFN